MLVVLPVVLYFVGLSHSMTLMKPTHTFFVNAVTIGNKVGYMGTSIQ
jgi:hypothetical protein